MTDQNDMCCGGTRLRKGCEYHDPALPPLAAGGTMKGRPHLKCCVEGLHSFSWRVGAEACRYCGTEPDPAPTPSEYLRVETAWSYPEGACGPYPVVRAALEECVRSGHLDPSQVGQVKAEQRPDGGWTLTLPGRVHEVSVKGAIEF